ncbi:hypothetical protein P9112_003425 [Eukaryota sp. TZLM1-RC]
MNTPPPPSTKRPKGRRPPQSRPVPSAFKNKTPQSSHETSTSLKKTMSTLDLSDKTPAKPVDQLDLNSEDLETDIQRILTTQNPQSVHNIVSFNRAVVDGHPVNAFVPTSSINQSETHFSLDGPLIPAASPDPITPSPALLTRNQFNFIDRGTQSEPTFHPKVDASTSVHVSKSKIFSGTSNRGAIYDAYVDHNNPNKNEKKNELSPHSKAFIIAERMTLQNSFADVICDLHSFDHLGDNNPMEASVLPLWKLSPFGKCDDVPRSKSLRTVTAVAINPKYNDLIAVGLGSLDFSIQGGGAIVLFSLKSPSHPLSVLRVFDAGVLCLSWNETFPELLAVGLYNGSVGVVDCQSTQSIKMITRSTAGGGKHSDSCWTVQWLNSSIKSDEETEIVPTIISIGSDGRVLSWQLVQNSLLKKEISKLSDEKGSSLLLSCLDFSPFDPRIFLVGTENGQVYQCSLASSGPLFQYQSHDLVVSSVQWSPFCQDVFLSCSADWSLRLYSTSSKSCLLSFDLGGGVTDLAWSPLCSTIFCATVQTGRLYGFDLGKSCHSPICNQVISEKAGLSRVEFNNTFKIVCVGDERGNCHILKLSPNLRPDVRQQFESKSTENIKIALTLEELERMNGNNDQKDEESLSVEEKVKQSQIESLVKIIDLARKTRDIVNGN